MKSGNMRKRKNMRLKKELAGIMCGVAAFTFTIGSIPAGAYSVWAEESGSEESSLEESSSEESSLEENGSEENGLEADSSDKAVVGFVRSIPLDVSYAQECDEKGTVETLTYTCHSYALEAVTGKSDIMVEKSMNIYLPCGYDENTKYDVLYLLHGTGGFEDYWIGDSSTGKMTCNVLDNMIKKGESQPVIIVSPTYYSPTEDMGYRDLDPVELFNTEKDPYADQWPMYFWEELRNDIIPLVESTYSTYADKDVTLENLQKTRDYRGFAGLSRGSKTTVNSGMMHCADLFSYIGSYSGAWADVAEFKNILESDEYKDYDFKYWYNGNGTADFSLENHEEFLSEVLEEMPDRFSLDKNVAWVVFQDGGHAYNCWIADLYNSLLAFFKQN